MLPKPGSWILKTDLGKVGYSVWPQTWPGVGGAYRIKGVTDKRRNVWDNGRVWGEVPAGICEMGGEGASNTPPSGVSGAILPPKVWKLVGIRFPKRRS